MKQTKHIAMWVYPRSCSTVITRAFENLDGCVLYDEPFLAPSISIRGEILGDENLLQLFKLNDIETNYKKVVQKITGDLPDGKLFSFQKILANHYLPEFGIDWAKKITNFFLIRHPQEVILSFDKAVRKFNITEPLTLQDVGFETLDQIFQQIELITGQTSLVIHSDNIMKNPSSALQWLCKNLGIAFDERMLIWKAGLEDSNLLFAQLYPNPEYHDSEPWFKTLRSSQTFIPYKKKEIDLPDRLIPLLEESMPYYEKLLQYCHIFEWSEHR